MKRKLIFCGVTAMLLLASTASAAITGQMSGSGSVRVGQTTIDWVPLGGPTGIMNTIFPGTGYFSGIYNPAVNPPTTADVLDLDQTVTPVGSPVSVLNFLSNFSAGGAYSNLAFELTFIFQSLAPVCTGGEGINTPCQAVAGSPFTLTNTQTGVDIRFNIAGIFTDPDEGGPAPATGSYTTQLDGQSVASVLQTLGTVGFVDSSYSANFTVIPEPSTTMMMLAGFGLLAAGVVRRKKS
jgi:hypothetical protein